MRNRLSIVAVALAMTGASAPNARAQSEAADATMQVNILSSTLNVVNTSGLDFGSRFASDGVVHSSDAGTYASWNINVTGATNLQLTFTLPTELSDAGGTSAIPVAYGSTAGHVAEPAGVEYWFDPAAGHVMNADPGGQDLTVWLGDDWYTDGTGDVSLDLTGAGPGVHTATATLTVTVL